jgi:5-methylcytosine-specific restriction endonuclease McrA
MAGVILLDINWQYHNTISVKKAMNLICRGVVEVVKTSDKIIHSNIFIPLVLRLLKSIRKFYGAAIRWSKYNLFIRDGFTCAYCGVKLSANKLTIDHVYPQELGGKTEWENCVAACNPCNNKKANKSLREVGYTLKKKPVQPTVMEFTRKQIKELGYEQLLKDIGVY